MALRSALTREAPPNRRSGDTESLAIDRLAVRHGGPNGLLAVQRLDLSIEAGEFHAISRRPCTLLETP